MNKLAKGFLLTFAALVILALLLVLGMNLYVESEGVQTRLETALRRELKMPIKVTQIHFSPWGGLRVMGLTVPAAPSPATTPPAGGAGQEPAPKFLEAPEVTLLILWQPLLARRLVVRELVISSPTIVWTQTSKGKWRLPKTEARPMDADPATAQTDPATLADEGASPKPRRPKAAKPTDDEGNTAPSLAEGTPAAGPKKLEFKVEATRIENATFRFLDKENRPIAVLEGVTVNCPSVGAEGVEGVATIAKLTLHNTILVENISTPFTYRDEQLTLPQIGARLAGGTLHAAYVLQPMKGNAPFTLDLAFDGVDLNRLITEAGAGEPGTKAEGTLRGTLDLYGRSGQGKSLGGAGQVVLQGGRMEQYPLLQMIGQALQIDELTRLDLRQAQLDLRVGENRVYIDSLLLESANLNLSAEGESRFNGKLDLAAGLAINPKISQQLPRWIAANFKPVEGSEQRIIHFGVTGTLQHPETDLLGVLVGEKLEKQASDLFHVFRALTSGGGGSGGKKKKKANAGKKTDTPEVSKPAGAAAASPKASPTAAASPSLLLAPSPQSSLLPLASPAATPSQPSLSPDGEP